jgi:hypothetical protein
MTIDIQFNDSGRTATQPSNPKYPDGIDVSVAKPGEKACCWSIPYPAPRCVR